MDTPAFDATRFVWPTLLTIALYALVIVISLMTMVKPAQAAGTVSPSFTFCLWVSLNPWARPACGFDSAVAACAAVGETAQTNGSCQSGYYYWTASSTSTCPANSTGTPASNPTSCTCNDPSVTDPTAYVPDPNGASCIPETNTIALHGLGVELMTNTTLDAYAEVTTSSGSPKSGAHVDLKLTVVPELTNQLPVTYTGTLSTYAGSTGADGRLTFEFRAPTAGGIHTITASCTNCTNQATGTIKVPGCPVSGLTPIADLSALAEETPEQKLLTQQLEGGMDGYSLLSPATRAAEQCLAGRINTVVGPPSTSGYQVTSTIRTLAYQKHLWEVWDRFKKLKGKVASDPTIQQRCQTLIAKVEGEMGLHLTQDPTDEDDKCSAALGRAHCIRSGPAQFDPKHTQNIAFDISMDAVTNFQNSLVPPSTVQEEANACGLTWGGTFVPIDEVHFVLH